MVSWFFLLGALSLVWAPASASAGDKNFVLMIPAGIDVGAARRSGTKSSKLGAELSVVDVHRPTLGWFGGFAGVGSAARGAEAAFGAELGFALLGADIGPIWRASEADHWGWRSRVHLTWFFSSLYVGFGEFARGGQILDVGLHFKPAWPLIFDMRRDSLSAALNAYERRGWTVH